jgi:hypothetical protein
MVVSWSSSAQFFNILNNEVLWQGLYETQLNQKDILKSMYTSNNFSNIFVVDSTMITGLLKPIKFNIEDYGLRYMKTPMFLSQNMLGPAFFVIEIKEGKYRVTVRDIRLTAHVNTQLTPYGSVSHIESIALSEGNFTSSFLDYADTLYHQLLVKAFIMVKWNEEW